jgi:hypothetical protein
VTAPACAGLEELAFDAPLVGWTTAFAKTTIQRLLIGPREARAVFTRDKGGAFSRLTLTIAAGGLWRAGNFTDDLNALDPKLLTELRVKIKSAIWKKVPQPGLEAVKRRFRRLGENVSIEKA